MEKEEIILLKKMQKEQKQKINHLSINQKQLLEGQAKLIRTTKQLEEGQEKLEKGQEEIKERVTNLEEGQKRLEKGQEGIVVELKRLNDVVTVMEVENSKKFDMICNALNIKQEPERIDNKKEVTFRLLKGNKEEK